MLLIRTSRTWISSAQLGSGQRSQETTKNYGSSRLQVQRRNYLIKVGMEKNTLFVEKNDHINLFYHKKKPNICMIVIRMLGYD